MKRKQTVKVPTAFGTIEATVKFVMNSGYDGSSQKSHLNRDEQQLVVDRVTDDVVNALRGAPFVGEVPLRVVRIS